MDNLIIAPYFSKESGGILEGGRRYEVLHQSQNQDKKLKACTR